MIMNLFKKLLTPTIMLGWALYYYIEICGKKASAGIFIKPVFWIMVLLYIIIVFTDTRDWLEEKKKAALEAVEETEEEKAARLAAAKAEQDKVIRVVICICAGLLYVFSLPYLGFIISTSVILFGMFLWLKAPNKIAACVLAILIAVAMYALFKIGLKVPLHTGFLGI